MSILQCLVEESDKVTQHIPGARTKNLFLKDENGEYHLVTLPSHKRLNLKFLKQTLGVKELRFGSPEELLEELHLTPGSVSPLGMMHAKHTQFILDEELWNASEIGAHPNINTATLVLAHVDLAKFYAALSCPKRILALP